MVFTNALTSNLIRKSYTVANHYARKQNTKSPFSARLGYAPYGMERCGTVAGSPEFGAVQGNGTDTQ